MKKVYGNSVRYVVQCPECGERSEEIINDTYWCMSHKHEGARRMRPVTPADILLEEAKHVHEVS